MRDWGKREKEEEELNSHVWNSLILCPKNMLANALGYQKIFFLFYIMAIYLFFLILNVIINLLLDIETTNFLNHFLAQTSHAILITGHDFWVSNAYIDILINELSTTHKVESSITLKLHFIVIYLFTSMVYEWCDRIPKSRGSFGKF